MRRKLIIGGVILALAAGVAKVSFRKLRAHQRENLTAAAEAFLMKDDLRGAYLTAQEVRQMDPQNPKACEILARVAARENSPAAILWYEELAKLCPGNDEITFTLARTAAGFGETPVAEQALARLSEPSRNTVAYHELAAACAIQEKAFAQAREHFEKAIDLAAAGPGVDRLQLNLATLELGMGDPEMKLRARNILDALRKDPRFRQSAARALLADARANKEEQRAVVIATDLKNSPEADFQDELSYLESIQHAPNSPFDRELSKVLKKAATDPGAAYTLLTWMNAHGLPNMSIQWFAEMQAPLRAQISIKLAVADAYCASKNWDPLRRLTTSERGAWGALEFLRLAFKARSIVGDGYDPRRKTSAAESEWQSAVSATAGNRDMLSMLARLANGWGWRTESVEVWWLVARHQAAQRIALKELFRIASAAKDAPELYRVARRIYQLDPGNAAARNNAAMLGLLLGKDMQEAHEIGADLYKSFPDSPPIASTRAFSLYLQGKFAEASEVMAKLPETALRQPSLAACYGIILAAGEHRENARPYLQAALSQKSELFSEEIDLVKKAFDQNSAENKNP